MATLEIKLHSKNKVEVSNGGRELAYLTWANKRVFDVDFDIVVPVRQNQRGEALTPVACVVYHAAHGYGFGRADCSPHDVFSVDIGRKLALSRALEHFPREFREEVWKAVFETGVIRQ